MSDLEHTTIPTIETTTSAEYHRDDMVPIPSSMQPENVEFCVHDLTKGNCRHQECPFYTPHESKSADGRGRGYFND